MRFVLKKTRVLRSKKILFKQQVPFPHPPPVVVVELVAVIVLVDEVVVVSVHVDEVPPLRL